MTRRHLRSCDDVPAPPDLSEWRDELEELSEDDTDPEAIRADDALLDLLGSVGHSSERTPLIFGDRRHRELVALLLAWSRGGSGGTASGEPRMPRVVVSRPRTAGRLRRMPLVAAVAALVVILGTAGISNQSPVTAREVPTADGRSASPVSVRAAGEAWWAADPDDAGGLLGGSWPRRAYEPPSGPAVPAAPTGRGAAPALPPAAGPQARVGGAAPLADGRGTPVVPGPERPAAVEPAREPTVREPRAEEPTAQEPDPIAANLPDLPSDGGAETTTEAGASGAGTSGAGTPGALRTPAASVAVPSTTRTATPARTPTTTRPRPTTTRVVPPPISATKKAAPTTTTTTLPRGTAVR